MAVFFFSTFWVIFLAALIFLKNGLSLAWAAPLLPLVAFVYGFVLQGRPRRPGPSPAIRRENRDVQVMGQFTRYSSQPSLLVQNGCISNVNRALLKALFLEGRSDDLIGMPLANIVHPKHHGRLTAMLSDEIASSGHGVFTLLRADGMPWVARMQVFRGHDSGASLLHFSAPEESQATGEGAILGQRLVNASREALFALDSQLLVSYLNPQGERLARRNGGRALFFPFLSLFLAEDRTELSKGLRQLQAGSMEVLVMEARMPLARGSGPHWVEVRAWPMQLALEEASGIAGVMLDISQRKRNEDVMRAQRRSLHTMLDNLPGMIYRGQNDRRWTIEFISEGCFELTGYTPLELIDNQAACLADLIHPEDREYVWNFVQMRLVRRERYELNYRLVDRDGAVHWVWEQGRGMYSSKGEFLGLEGYITEVSSRGAQEEARRRLFFDNAAGILSLSIFTDRLCHVFSHGPSVGYPFLLVYLGLENLDRVAAAHGFAMVDRLLVETGKRLRVVLGDSNGVARHGGGGFVVLISDFRSDVLGWATGGAEESPVAGDSERIVAALRGLVERPLRIEGHEFALRVRTRMADTVVGYAGAQAMLEDLAG